jgi:hypothetical protein
MSKGTVNIPITHYDDLKSIIGKWKELHTQAINKIAKLEKRLSNAETMGDKEQSIRDLEQQAKGLTDYAKNQESGIDAVWIISAASKLLSQAKALKEQE